MEKVTVIIPCYNVEAFIHECLDSVALQGNVVHHIYVVDNNSTDDTVSKVHKWQNANPTSPLTLLSETKPGAPAARNLPLNRVETKWIQFLDADDLLLPGKIIDQIRQFPKADVICAASKHLATDDSERISIPQLDVRLGLIKGEMGNTCANLFSASSIQAIHGWNELLNSSQEYDLMFRIWRTGATFEVDLTPRAVIRAREMGQISQCDPEGRWSRLVGLRMRMLQSMLHSGIGSQEKQTLLQSVFDFVRVLFPLNEEEAAIHYKKLVALGFKPQTSPTSSVKYIISTRLIGVIMTERYLKRLPQFKRSNKV